MEDESNSGIRRVINATYDRIPEIIIASIIAIFVFQFNSWINHRDLAGKVSEIERYIGRNADQMEQMGTFVRRDECEAVKAVLSEHALRLTAIELNLRNHETIAGERIKRIESLEQEVRRIRYEPTARSDPFTGTEGRKLEDRINELERKNKQ